MDSQVTLDELTRDEKGSIVKIYHRRNPFQVQVAHGASTNGVNGGGTTDAINGVGDVEDRSPRELADVYLKEILPVYGYDESMASDLSSAVHVNEAVSEGEMLRYSETQSTGKVSTVSYIQTKLGLPVWQSGISVKVIQNPNRVVNSVSSLQGNVEIQLPPPNSPYLPNHLTASKAASLLSLNSSHIPIINSTRLLIYQFDEENRGNAVGDRDLDDETNMHLRFPTLQVPHASSSVVSGRFYVVSEVLFTLSLAESGTNNWRAFIEPQTGSVLLLDVFVGCVDGLVYLRDPLTKTGDITITPISATSVLDSFRDLVPLDDLIASDPQHLRSEFVHVRDVSAPNTLPPTRPSGKHFAYSVTTDNFAAVNAFYHCDRLFRMMVEMGFNVQQYFNGTVFPVRVDHRTSYGWPPTANIVNASAPGDAQGDGSDGFRFALLHMNTKIGMAVSWRVTLHEFGHAILWDHVNSPNFRFAHSAGDAMASILNDPGSQAPDRFLSFPWTIIRRRHDRRVEDGWGWGGKMDPPRPVGFPGPDRAGYDREQILSSTLFRYYRAIGGDHSDVSVRQQASRYALFIILTAVGLLNVVSQPQNAKAFAEDLMEADMDADLFDGLPGGMTHKVIRWAFERQGMYQSPDAPSPTILPGAPPSVDVYIDDGRDGGYEPQPSFVFSSKDIWNRNAADNGLAHQNPIVGQSNYFYVRVKNRGSDLARMVDVKAYVTTAIGERIWPQQWQALDKASESEDVSIEPGEETVVGPFVWSRNEGSVVSLLASVSAEGDNSNLETVKGPVPIARLAHCDNNVAGRIIRFGEAPPVLMEPIKVETWPNLPIPDADNAGVVTTLTVSTDGNLKRLRAGVTIVHTYVGDLRLLLTSPSGTEILLFEGSGPGNNLIEVFTLRNVPDLNNFTGETVLGTWKLRVTDRIGQDVGRIVKWGLDIEV